MCVDLIQLYEKALVTREQTIVTFHGKCILLNSYSVASLFLVKVIVFFLVSRHSFSIRNMNGVHAAISVNCSNSIHAVMWKGWLKSEILSRFT